MPNGYHNKQVSPLKKSGGGGGNHKAQGSSPSEAMPEKTASWPGLPGASQPKARNGGTPSGPFYVKKAGI